MSSSSKNCQTVLVFQQRKKAETKIEWIRQYKEKLFNVEVIDITSDTPNIIDNSSEYLPKTIAADLVLDYLEHPDLSHDLAKLCIKFKIPIVASGKKISLWEKHYTPKVCCALSKTFSELGQYGKYFGKPKLNITTKNNKIAKIEVLRGSPCGSTWKAANKTVGLPIKNFEIEFGLKIQFFCTATTNNYNPLNSKNPIHTAAEIHKKSVTEALSKNKNPTNKIHHAQTTSYVLD